MDDSDHLEIMNGGRVLIEGLRKEGTVGDWKTVNGVVVAQHARTSFVPANAQMEAGSQPPRK